MKKVVSGGPVRAVAFPLAVAGLPDTTFFISAPVPYHWFYRWWLLIPPQRGRPSEKPPAGKWRRRMKQRFNKEKYGQPFPADSNRLPGTKVIALPGGRDLLSLRRSGLVVDGDLGVGQ
jgi:hypothetical protein